MANRLDDVGAAAVLPRECVDRLRRSPCCPGPTLDRLDRPSTLIALLDAFRALRAGAVPPEVRSASRGLLHRSCFTNRAGGGRSAILRAATRCRSSNRKFSRLKR